MIEAASAANVDGPEGTADQAPLPGLAPRDERAHKGSFGRALIVAGSRGMIGAAGLAALAALRAGAGLVMLAAPDTAQRLLAPRVLSAVTVPLLETAEGTLAAGARRALSEPLSRATCALVGPGLTTHPETAALVCELLASDCRVPTVIDADALNVIAEAPGGAREFLARRASAGGTRVPVVLTPHAAEMARLSGTTVAAIEADRLGSSRAFVAGLPGVTLVLKGHRTLIARDGAHAINPTGNPGMATGGSGDVLAGLLVGLLAQGLAPFDAARVAAHVHGQAGDLGAEALGELSLTAEDMLDFLPAALRAWRNAAGS